MAERSVVAGSTCGSACPWHPRRQSAGRSAGVLRLACARLQYGAKSKDAPNARPEWMTAGLYERGPRFRLTAGALTDQIIQRAARLGSQARPRALGVPKISHKEVEHQGRTKKTERPMTASGVNHGQYHRTSCISLKCYRQVQPLPRPPRQRRRQGRVFRHRPQR